MSKRALWNLTIALSGLGYLILALWLNIQSPLFAALFVMSAGYEVVKSRSRRKPRRAVPRILHHPQAVSTGVSSGSVR